MRRHRWVLTAVEFNDWHPTLTKESQKICLNIVAGRPAIVLSVRAYSNYGNRVEVAENCKKSLKHLIYKSTGDDPIIVSPDLPKFDKQRNKIIAIFDRLASVANFMLRIGDGIDDYSPFQYSEKVCRRFCVTEAEADPYSYNPLDA